MSRSIAVLLFAGLMAPSIGARQSAPCNDQARRLAESQVSHYETHPCNTGALELALPGISGNPIPKECNKSWVYRDKALFLCQIQLEGSHCKVKGEKSHREIWGFYPPTTDPCPNITNALVETIKDLIKKGDVSRIQELLQCKPMMKLSEGNDWSAFQSNCPEEQKGSDAKNKTDSLPQLTGSGRAADPLGSKLFYYYKGDPYDLMAPGKLEVFDDGTVLIAPDELPPPLAQAVESHGPLAAAAVQGTYVHEEFTGPSPYLLSRDFTARVDADGEFHSVETSLVPTEGELLPMTRELFFDGANLFLYFHGNGFTDVWTEGHPRRFVPAETLGRHALHLVEWLRDPLDVPLLPGWSYSCSYGVGVEVTMSHAGLAAVGIGSATYRWDSTTSPHPAGVTYYDVTGNAVRTVDFDDYREVDAARWRPFQMVDTVLHPDSGTVVARTRLELRRAQPLAADALDGAQPPGAATGLWRIWL